VFFRALQEGFSKQNTIVITNCTHATVENNRGTAVSVSLLRNSHQRRRHFIAPPGLISLRTSAVASSLLPPRAHACNSAFPLYSLEKNETEMVMAKRQIRDRVIELKQAGQSGEQNAVHENLMKDKHDIGSEKMLYLSTTPLTGGLDK
jgi:hypothetical protein